VLWNNLVHGRDVWQQWLSLARRRRPWKALVRTMERLDSNDRRRGYAVIALAESLIDDRRYAAFRTFVKRHESPLRAESFLWGMTGHFFSYVHDDHGAAAWLHDWRERSDLQGWMLMNLALALTGLKRWTEAQEAHRFAVENLEPDHVFAYHEAWLALDSALAGDVAAVRAYFAKLGENDLDPNHQWIAALTRAVLGALTARDKSKALARAQRHLVMTARRLEPIDGDACFVVAYRKACGRIADVCGKKWNVAKPILPKRKKAGT
jgi:hypothetical protein